MWFFGVLRCWGIVVGWWVHTAGEGVFETEKGIEWERRRDDNGLVIGAGGMCSEMIIMMGWSCCDVREMW